VTPEGFAVVLGWELLCRGVPFSPARGLVVHAGLGRRPPLGDSLEVEAAEAAHLVIGDHPKASWGEGLRIAYGPSGERECEWPLTAASFTSGREI
jgi:hypothetical protein